MLWTKRREAAGALGTHGPLCQGPQLLARHPQRFQGVFFLPSNWCWLLDSLCSFLASFSARLCLRLRGREGPGSPSTTTQGWVPPLGSRTKGHPGSALLFWGKERNGCPGVQGPPPPFPLIPTHLSAHRVTPASLFPSPRRACPWRGLWKEGLPPHRPPSPVAAAAP